MQRVMSPGSALETSLQPIGWFRSIDCLINPCIHLPPFFMKTLDRSVVTQRATSTHPKPIGQTLPKPTIGAALAIASAACYGIAWVISKDSLNHIPPTLLITIQSFASVLCLSLLIRHQGRKLPGLSQLITLGSIGILEPGLSYILSIQGLMLTTASNASLIGALEPIVTILLACLLLRERFDLFKMIIAALSIVGVCLISTAGISGSPTLSSSLSGDGLVLIGVFFAALYAIASQRSMALSRTLDPLIVAWAQQSIALLFFISLTIGAAATGIEPLRLDLIGPLDLLVALVTGLLGHCLAFWLYLKALRYLSASDCSLYLSLIPVFGMTGALVFLGEQLSWNQGLGGLVVIGAIGTLALTQGESKERSA
jgi:drug/metabolite transporter (DMT)-like permease